MPMTDPGLRDVIYNNSGLESVISGLDLSAAEKDDLRSKAKAGMENLAKSFNDYYKANMDINGVNTTVSGIAAVTTAPGSAPVTGSGSQSIAVHPL